MSDSDDARETRAVSSGVVHLQSLGPQDEGEVHRLLCVPEVYEYLADGAEPPPAITADWIRTAAGSSLELGGGIWALTFPQERGVFGVVRLADDGKNELELTYLLHPDLWGLGYATRMAHTAMNRAFGAGRVAAIWAGADVPNKASIAVMERLGMRFRRKVDYPAGEGVEYVMEAGDFDGSRFEFLPIE